VIDRIVEIAETLDRNRLRTGLTALAVAWGIFVFVVLMGAGSGLENALNYQFRDDATNSIWIFRGQTSRPWQGYKPGRNLRFTNMDHDRIAAVPGVEHITSRFMLWGDMVVRWKDRYGDFEVRSCHPAHQYLEKTNIVAGRFLVDADLEERRKVAVIGEEVSTHLFRGLDPLGEWIDVKGIAYRVVGVFHDEGGLGELKKVYIPITTAQAAYGGGDTVHMIMFTVGEMTLEQSQNLTKSVTEVMAQAHHFDPDDARALRVRNNLEEIEKVRRTMGTLRAFLWVVGLGTIAAGVVGVGNILLVSVAERTGEIGLRKALGATPFSVVFMILQEAMLLTSGAGYLGLVAGVGFVEAVHRLMPENDYLRDPRVDLGVAFAAVLVLVIAGLMAGLVPAWRAAAIPAADALREAA
jgi:putative ABC transport system permease protein